MKEINHVDFDKLQRIYNLKLRIKRLIIFFLIYFVLLFFTYALAGKEAAITFSVPLLIAWIITQLITR